MGDDLYLVVTPNGYEVKKSNQLEGAVVYVKIGDYNLGKFTGVDYAASGADQTVSRIIKKEEPKVEKSLSERIKMHADRAQVLLEPGVGVPEASSILETYANRVIEELAKEKIGANTTGAEKYALVMWDKEPIARQNKMMDVNSLRNFGAYHGAQYQEQLTAALYEAKLEALREKYEHRMQCLENCLIRIESKIKNGTVMLSEVQGDIERTLKVGEEQKEDIKKTVASFYSEKPEGTPEADSECPYLEQHTPGAECPVCGV